MDDEIQDDRNHELILSLQHAKTEQWAMEKKMADVINQKTEELKCQAQELEGILCKTTAKSSTKSKKIIISLADAMAW